MAKRKVTPAQKKNQDRMKRAAAEYRKGNYSSMQQALKNVR